MGDEVHTTSLRRALLRFGALTAAALLALGAPTALAQEPEPALRTTVEFDKQHYLLHENMRIKFTITNVGTRAAEHVRLPFPLGSPMYDRWNWQPLRPTDDGITVAPGETRVLEFSGAVADRYNRQNATAGFTDRYLNFTGRKDNKEDRFGALATVTPTAGDVRGVVYGDKNRNGRQDDGEVLAGTAVTIWGAYGNRAERTTSSDGRFLFEGVEGGPWLAGYRHPDGWVVPRGDGAAYDLLVTPTGVELSVRAERPATDSVQAQLDLDRTTYRAGDPVTITATLTNSGTVPVDGVQAACLDYGSKQYIGSRVSWGDLAPTGRGVTLAAGETRKFSVTDVVPQEALGRGEVVAVCQFGPRVLEGNGNAEATAKAAVSAEPVTEEPPTPGPVPPGPSGAAQPQPQPQPQQALARTGASVLGLGLLGVLLVALGAGALAASRNREARDTGRA
ncbi:hypothetical protein [Lentzea sp.]|uniref:hypothetical protein n=1 Tax=Lentzea sp. TaxID=56099 RepID=UPI002ED1F841